jgi:uncharacterized damage-inducible protein DinB
MSDSPHRELVLAFDEAAPPGVNPWLAALQDTRRRTLDALEGITDSAIDWTDEEGSSIGSLLYHIAAIELDWLYAEILEQDFPPDTAQLFPVDVRDADGKLMAMRGEMLDDYKRRLDRVRNYLIDALQAMAPAEFVRVRRLDHYDVSPLWVLHHLMQHEAEHRGQIMALRMRAERVTSDE